MSRWLAGKLFVLIVAVNCAVGVTNVLQVETPEAVKPNDSDAADSQTDSGNEVPIGRTLLLLHLIKQKLSKLNQLEHIATPTPPFTGCLCVPFYLCNANGTIITDGSGIIDYRQRQCTGDLEVCCFLRLTPPIPPIPPTTPARPPATTAPAPPPTPIPTLPMTPPTIPTMPVTVPTTVFTTPPTLPPTVMTLPPPTTPRPIPTVAPTIFPYCICVPIYQCSLYAQTGAPNPPGVPGMPGIPGMIDPRQQFANTCIGAFVCCGYAPGVMPVPLPGSTPSFPPFLLPSVPPPTVPSTPQPVLPPIIPGQSCICMLLNACLLGWIPMSGAGNIDPRLILGRQGQLPGTCSPNSMCCRLVQDNASFPVQPSGVPSAVPPVVPPTLPNFGVSDVKNPGTANACVCVATSQCPEGNAVTYDNIGAIDPRFGPCASATLVCCKLLNRQRSEVAVGQIVLPPTTQLTCGLRDTTYAATTQPSVGSTYFAEFPWMALLLIRKAGSSDVFQCGGSLINSRIVLTAAHCVVACDPGTLIVRLGEWNTQSTSEPLPFQEYTVQRFIVHPQYYGGALYNDFALIVLQRPVTYAVNIRPVCLAALGQNFAPGTTCYASGWGRSAFGTTGQYQTILRKVDLPVIDNANCQARLRLTRLGQAFQLHPSFMCAGGVASKDTCYKDGGGPLVCQEPVTGRFAQAGIISWGIGCGDNTPAVYASVAYARQWIDQQLASLGIPNV